MRVLGVDIGLARTGLALSDPLGISVRGLPTLTPASRAKDVAHLVALVDEHAVERVVIGLPLLPVTGDDGMMARRVRGFARALALALDARGAQVHLLDETGSSKEAARALVARGVKASKRRALLDTEVACSLVERFLCGEQGELVLARANDDAEA